MTTADILKWVASWQQPMNDILSSWFEFLKYGMTAMFVYTVGFLAGRLERHVNQ